MANSGGGAATGAGEVRIPMGEWEGRDGGRSRTSNNHHQHHQNQQQQSPRAGSNHSDGSSHHHPQQSPLNSSPASSATRLSQIAPTQGGADVAAAAPRQKPEEEVREGGLAGKLWKLLFFLHLLAVLVLVIYLSATGLRRRHFRATHFYPPLLVSAAFAALLSLTFLSATLRHPAGTVRASLWLGPVMTCALGMLLFNATTAVGIVFGVVAVVSAAAVAVYSCWATPRLQDARDVLASSLDATRLAIQYRKFAKFMFAALFASVVYSGLWILAAGGVVAIRPRLSALYVILLLLSLAWTMQVIRNVIHVAISGFAYMHLTRQVYIDPSEAFLKACTLSLGSVCLGSAVVPVVGFFRWTARAMDAVAGDTDEFLFSCSHCYMGLAERLLAYGNRWGFVMVGVYAKGFVASSKETWESFEKQEGMRKAVDSDLTSSFCLLCGLAGGSLAALLAGVWVLVVDRAYVGAVSLYAFCISYFVVRIAMAWPQACVSAGYVAFAEYPQLHLQQIQSPLADLIRRLQRPHV